MCLKSLLFVTFSILLFQHSYSQHNYGGYNHLGVNGGITIFDINTSDFQTESGTGFFAGFTSRGDFYESYDIIYGINFSQTDVAIKASNLLETKFVEYTIQAAQLNFLGSYNIFRHHLSIELGPVLTVNSKMKLKSDEFEDYIVDGYSTLRAQDIQEISTINLHALGGIMVGVENFRVSAHYQYGLTNMLNKLNSKSLENSNFKGNSSTILLAAVIYF